MAEREVRSRRLLRTYAWADAGDDGDGFAGHGAELGDDGEESVGGVHELRVKERELVLILLKLGIDQQVGVQ